MPAKDPQHVAAPVQHSSKQQARRQLNGTIKGGEPFGGPAA